MKRPPGHDMLDRARRLRREMTPQEAILWRHLRDRRLAGMKFRKQIWLAGYVADFACPEARLVVEADGSQHAEDVNYDTARERAFARLGWKTLRFWNNEITDNLEGVLTVIAEALPSPSHALTRAGPSLSPAGRGEGWARASPLSLQGRGRGPPGAAGWEGEGTPQSPLNSGAFLPPANASNALRKSFVAMQMAWAWASISMAVSRLTFHS
jgi:very-short-patch-repair endonuclease